MEEKRKKSTKKFLEKPQYPGGRKALDVFVSAHLQYPEDAMKQRIEGIVTVAFQVNDDGRVESASILKSLCPSCDEEALRIVRMLRYGQARNRGVRLKANCKLHVRFSLAPTPPQTTITYTVTPSKTKSAPKPKASGYSVSIVLPEVHE
jgi:protein TonB